jgi:hypothetical protein
LSPNKKIKGEKEMGKKMIVGWTLAIICIAALIFVNL